MARQVYREKQIKPISPKMIDYFILLKVGHIQYENNPRKIFGITQSSWHVPSKLSTNTCENQHWRFLGTDRSHQRIHAFGYSTDWIPVVSVSSIRRNCSDPGHYTRHRFRGSFQCGKGREVARVLPGTVSERQKSTEGAHAISRAHPPSLSVRSHSLPFQKVPYLFNF